MSAGKTTTIFPHSPSALNSIVVLNNDDIIIGGNQANNFSNFAIVRLTTSGILDSTFGNAGQVKITVVDFTGNIKLQTTANNNVYNLNIAPLKAGNYLLKIETNGDVITKKFVKD